MKHLIALLLISQPALASPTPQQTNAYAQIGAALVAGAANREGDRAAECQAARDLQFYQRQDPSTPVEDHDWVSGIIRRAC